MIDIWRFSAIFFSTPRMAYQLSEKTTPALPPSLEEAKKKERWLFWR
jgi:hypothetical protein